MTSPFARNAQRAVRSISSSLSRPAPPCRYLSSLSSNRPAAIQTCPLNLPHWRPSKSHARSLGDFAPPSRSTLHFLRPFHVSVRALDRQQRHDPSLTPSPDSSHQDHKEPRASSPSDLDDHIQHQHTNPIPPNTNPKARMLIGFTCTVCNNRSHKTMSKHAYEHGVVIMQCGHCENRHLIADHLGWFKTGGVTVEDLVKERGETVQKLARGYQLLKNGEITDGDSGGDVSEAGAASGGHPAAIEDGSQIPKTDLELALEKAADGMLEWIPKDVLQQEEERMRTSRELLDHSKKSEK